MSYTSPGFWFFLAILLVGLTILPQRFRVGWLLVLSLLFYTAPDPVRFVWAVGLGAVTLAGLEMGTRDRPWLGRGAAIVILLVVLVWAKFADAVGLPDPGGPPGLSFIVFTAVALLAEAARRRESWSQADAALHIAWFPKLLAGPIERPQSIMPQLPALGLKPDMAALGLSFLLVGLVKKLVIADSLAPVVDAAYAIPAYAPPMELLLATYFFAFQIYCDFSGYADIAVGLSLFVGLRLSRNFARPYLATTVTDFWAARWHITLGRWFRDFVYIPLGGSRAGRTRQMVNLMTVFMLSGLWHAGLGYGVGWGFLAWGALNGALVLGERLLPKPRRVAGRVLRTVVTFHLILFTWVFFRAADLATAWTILERIAEALPGLPALVAAYPFTQAHLWGFTLIAALLIVEIAAEARHGPSPVAELVTAARRPIRWAGWYAGLALLLVAGHWQHTEFIYAAF
ncbi:MAG: MBOAT family O-acyltransferase [Maritimibacter harenae]